MGKLGLRVTTMNKEKKWKEGKGGTNKGAEHNGGVSVKSKSQIL